MKCAAARTKHGEESRDLLCGDLFAPFFHRSRRVVSQTLLVPTRVSVFSTLVLPPKSIQYGKLCKDHPLHCCHHRTRHFHPLPHHVFHLPTTGGQKSAAGKQTDTHPRHRTPDTTQRSYKEGEILSHASASRVNQDVIAETAHDPGTSDCCGRARVCRGTRELETFEAFVWQSLYLAV